MAFGLLWIPATIAASLLQTARNLAQRSLTDIIGGHVPAMFVPLPEALPHAAAGKIRMLALSDDKRAPQAKDVPTIAESGLPGFEASAWDGLFVPAGTPMPIVERLNAAVRQALEEPELVAALLARGARPVPGTPESFVRFIAASAERWAVAVRASGAKID